MASGQAGTVLRHICRLFVAQRTRDQSDAQLLERFAAEREEEAFAALVQRHGRLVWGVCRNVLGNDHDAEDAFQATFLVLAGNAARIRKREALASWLHGTAYRTALRAKRDAAIRRAHERREPSMPQKSLPEAVVREALAMLDEEVQRLSPKQRAAFVLCSLEGKSLADAAQQLGWKEGTVSGTLARARRQLRERLAGRGVTLSATMTAVALGGQVASAVPPGLAKTTITAALGFAVGKTPAAAALSTAISLAERMTRIMFLTKVARATALVVAMSLMAAGTGFLTRGSLGEPTAEAGQSDGPPAAPAGQPLFQDVTAAAGVKFTYKNGEEADHYAILESIGGGVALIDYDGDGLLDIFLVGGGYFAGPDKKQIKGYPNLLYKNLGNCKFKDVTKEVGLDRPVFFGHGVAVADYDRDGWPDLLVTGYGRVVLYRNVPDGKGGRRFVDVTKEAGLFCGEEHFWATSAAFADLDGDGFPDLYICQYVNWSWQNNPRILGANGVRDLCPPKMFEARPHALFHNDGKGKFVNVTEKAGIRTWRNRQDKEFGKGLGVVVVDVNGDGRPDIFVANDTTDNFLYINQSQPGLLRFVEMGLFRGVARNDVGVPNGSMGVDAGDYNGSGRPSLWVVHYEGELHALYRNDGLTFLFNSQRSGIAAVGQRYVGSGTGFIDVDNDGWEDIFIANGHILRQPHPAKRRQPPVLLHNLGNGRFKDVSRKGGPYFQLGHCGRGVAIGDLDNDGWPDLVISHLNEPVAILKNTGKSGNHWVGVSLTGKNKRDVVGAKLTLEVNGRKLTRFAKGGGSYLSAGDRRHLFGLGSATKAGKLTVEWPSGQPRVESWDNLAIDRYHSLVQGTGRKPAE